MRETVSIIPTPWNRQPEVYIKLKYQYNFSPNSLSLIRSHLANRNQKVQINQSLSQSHEINMGVLQGSLIYINDIYFSIHDASVYLYADDHTLVFCDDNKYSLINKFNENFNAIIHY